VATPEVATTPTRQCRHAPRTATRHPVPQRADGLELIGEFKQSGYKDPPWLVRRADGQTVQLTRLLYAVLEVIDGRRDVKGIADAASTRIGRRASVDAIRFLIAERLRPLGLVKRSDGANPSTKKANPLLRVHARVALCSERVTRFITAPFSVLFVWPLVVAVVVAFAAMSAWLFLVKGVGESLHQVLYHPELLVIVFGLTILSAGFHEFGHAAACRYSGSKPGVIGAGFYIVWPVFYTDVTDSYRLSRRGRLRVDLGGLYFNAIFALATFGAWALFGWEAALILVPMQFLQMLRQLPPMIRLDGYHILADFTGVPDLFARIKPTLLSMIPWRRRDERATALKLWVRIVVTLWVLLVVPMLAFTMLMFALGLPRVLATLWDSAGMQWEKVSTAFTHHQYSLAFAAVIGILALALPVASGTYMLTRFGRRAVTSTWRHTDGKPMERGMILGGTAAAAALLLPMWWPNVTPMQAGESWTVPELVSRIPSFGAPPAVADGGPTNGAHRGRQAGGTVVNGQPDRAPAGPDSPSWTRRASGAPAPADPIVGPDTTTTTTPIAPTPSDPSSSTPTASTVTDSTVTDSTTSATTTSTTSATTTLSTSATTAPPTIATTAPPTVATTTPPETTAPPTVATTSPPPPTETTVAPTIATTAPPPPTTAAAPPPTEVTTP
jgi:putative peptide zinc metalloprotease protein